jgi:hypothetical protein
VLVEPLFLAGRLFVAVFSTTEIATVVFAWSLFSAALFDLL